MSSGIKKSLIALTLSGLFAAPSAFATNGYFAHGYSTKEKALAGAGVAHSQDAMAVANNPAGIAGMGERMDVGAAVFAPFRSYTVTGAPTQGCQAPGQCTFSLAEGTEDSNMNYFLIPHFAYNWKLDSDSSMALALYGNGGMNTNYKGGSATFSVDGTNGGFQTFPGTFGDGTTGVNLAQLFVNLSYGTKLNENHSVGASLVFAYQTFEAIGLKNFGGMSTDPANLSRNGADSSMGFGVKLGWQGKVAPAVTLGASYQSKMSMSEFEKYAGLFAEGGDFDIPATATVGISWETSKSSTLVFDVQSIYYSKVASIANPVAPLIDGSCQATPTGGNGTGCLGGSAGAGFGWEDMTVYKLGYEWGNDITWRVGVSSGKQPIPSTETMFNILAPAVMQTHLTFGMTLPMGANSEISLAGLYAPSNSVSGTSPFDPAQEIEIEMVQYEIQGTYSMKF